MEKETTRYSPTSGIRVAGRANRVVRSPPHSRPGAMMRIPRKTTALAHWGPILCLGLMAMPARTRGDPPSIPVTDTQSAPLDKQAGLEERLRKMEQMNERLLEQVSTLSKKVEELSAKEPATPASAPGDEENAKDSSSNRPAGSEANSSKTTNSRNREGIDAEGTGGRTFVRELASGKKTKTPAKVMFDEGIEFASEDDEFKLNFHNLTQAEYRCFPSQDLGTLKDQFFVPRQRWYFTGQATKNVEFYTVINRGYGSIDLLDAFITLNVSQSLSNETADTAGSGAQGEGGRTSVGGGRGNDARVRFRVGRMKTPYLYEYFSIAEGDLIAPERSIYAGNLAGNRQVGAMFVGDVFKDRVGYALGLFNGPRRSFQDFNNDNDIFFHINSRPFLQNDFFTALKYLNVGGDVTAGYENNPTQPTSFTTANDETASSVANSLSPTFLAFNSNVVEQGRRIQYGGHLAYFYKSFMLLGEYGGGTINYALANKTTTTGVPVQGWTVQAAYFLTGEELTRRVNVVRPLRNFGYTDGQFGIGAVEVHARFSEMNLGQQVFSAGLADPNLWSDKASATDIGANWYLNYYTKVYFDWQHAFYGQPITTGSTRRYMSTTDLFWLRFQLFF